MPTPKIIAAPRYVWLGSLLNLRAPQTGDEEPHIVATVKPGAELVVIGSVAEGLLVSFPTVPYLWTLSLDQVKHVQPKDVPAPEPLPVGEQTPESLLAALQHPDIIKNIKAMVELDPEVAKATAMPLVEPLVAAFVPAEQMPMVRQALVMFGIGT